MLCTAEPVLQPLPSLLEEEQAHISELKIQSAEEGSENLGHAVCLVEQHQEDMRGRNQAWDSWGEGGGEMEAPGRYFTYLGKWEAKLIVEGEEDDILYKVLLKR